MFVSEDAQSISGTLDLTLNAKTKVVGDDERRRSTPNSSKSETKKVTKKTFLVT
jgi:hypothetical protein